MATGWPAGAGSCMVLTISAVRVWANPDEVGRGGPHDRPAVLVDRLDQALQDAAVGLARRPARLHGGNPDTERVPPTARFWPAHPVQARAAHARLGRQGVVPDLAHDQS